MKTYKYRAMKEDGTKIEGKFEASSRDDVINMITSSGYYPLKIEEVVESKPIELKIFDRVTKKDLAVFCRQFYTMLDAGVSITNSINILSKEIPNKKLREILSNIEDDIKKGELLSESMAKYKQYFPQLLIKMVESGENSGNIDEMMLRMSVHFEKENKINNKVKSAMTYPAILSVVAVGAVMFIMTFVMPTFVEMFEGFGTELPFITRFMLATSEFLSNNLIIILLAIGILIVLFNIYKKSPHGIQTISSLKLKLPIIGNLNKKIIVSRFTRTLSTLLSAGVSLVHALPTVAGVLENKVAEDAILKIRERVVRGDGLSGPIRENDIFPKMLSSMIRIGEESGSLDSILNKTADFYDDEVEQAIQATTSLIEPMLIVVMGVVIGAIVISIMLPMFDMYSQM
ncbi:type II secretion system F family protein [Caproiciproducens sp. MSJ-32]|uniref:type II secretion system F family protein n=1 Tax=Caproiciproducens sp. MSJ-32 TaxID=2841527 RepID=UPI001C101401|nr:type II secretion system F family protein [Caproiciproducens sp. MSJ-32]MBU5453871.1 type II secretion system F family protein [Caproiciproducens sp. MSJ-32]